MYLERVRLFNFRNLENQTVEPCRGLNFFVGKNGQGKSNLLEAISVLSQGKSFRTSDHKELIKWGENQGSVFATVVSTALTGSSLGYELGLVIANGAREAWLNGEKLELFNDFIGKLVTVTFAPGDISLVKGPPQLRRKFLDRHLADYDPSIIKYFFTYQKALKHKAQLLKNGVNDKHQLDTWDQVLAESGCRIEQARISFIEKLAQKSGNVLSKLASVDGNLALNLESDLLKENQLLSAESIFASITKNRGREIATASCLTGPHRDDLAISLEGHDSRAFASQGQSRSIALSLKLAVIDLLESDRGEIPVVLLDDVESELDSDRSKALFEMVLKDNRQVFVTGTDTANIPKSGVCETMVFEISKGVIVT